MKKVLFLPEVYDDPDFIRFHESFDDLLLTLTTEPMQSVDNAMTYGVIIDKLTNFTLNLI